MSSSSVPAVPTRIGAFKAWLSVWIMLTLVALANRAATVMNTRAGVVADVR